MFILIALIYVAINYLIEKRVYQSLMIFHIPHTLFQVIFWICASSFVINMALQNILPRLLRIALAYIGSYYLAFLFYAIVLFSFSFIIHHFFKIKWDLYLLSIILIFAVIFPIGIFQQQHIITKDYEVTSSKLKQDYTIALVTDFHLGDLISKRSLQKIIDKINATQPDVVLIAGDLIDSNLLPVLENNSLALLKNINSRLGVYVTMGNHDFYTNETETIKTRLTELGIHVLSDESVLLENQLYLVGRNDSSFGHEDSQSLKTITSNIDNTLFQIVIDHNPARVNESIELNMDMQVSGHTHNGQLFPLNYITDAIFKVSYGHKKIDQTDVFVSGGIGSWGPKLRTSSTAEFSVIHLKKES